MHYMLSFIWEFVCNTLKCGTDVWILFLFIRTLCECMHAVRVSAWNDDWVELFLFFFSLQIETFLFLNISLIGFWAVFFLSSVLSLYLGFEFILILTSVFYMKAKKKVFVKVFFFSGVYLFIFVWFKNWGK